MNEPQAHLRRLRRRHDRHEGHRQRLRAGARAPEPRRSATARSSTRARCPSSSITEYEPLLDSANARPADWLRIARDIAEHRHSYDGFVVLHGTDTMAYTASALAFLLRGLGKPVVVTGVADPARRAAQRRPPEPADQRAGRGARRRARGLPRVRLADPARAAARSRPARAGSRPSPRPTCRRSARRACRSTLDAARLRAAEPRRDRRCRSRSTRHVALLRLYPGMPAALLRAALAEPIRGPGARGLRRRDVRRRRPVAARRARRRRAARRRDRRRQPVRRRPRRPRRLRDQRPAGRGGRGRRARHDHRGRLREARGAALRRPPARRRSARCSRSDLAGELTP